MTAAATSEATAADVLRALADRVECEPASRDLDAEIAAACRIVPDFDPSIYIVSLTYRALGGVVEIGHVIRGKGWWTEASRSPAHFTSSIDAAVTLIPDGATWMVANDDGAGIFLPRNLCRDNEHEGNHTGCPAASLTAAALRARAAIATVAR